MTEASYWLAFRNTQFTRQGVGGMRITVDLEMCEGNALCVDAAPTIFVLGDDDKVRLAIADVPTGDEERALLAVHLCPRQALAAER